MYVWIWRHLPGPPVVRALQSLVLLGAVVAALFLWVFPEVESRLPYQDVTVPVETAPSGSASPAPEASLAPTVGPTLRPTPAP